MEVTSATVFLNMVNSFTDADQLMDFAATWEILDSPAVRLRLYQLRNTNDEQSLPSVDQSIQQNVDLESVRMQEEVEESIKALLFDEEIESLEQSCIDDGEWAPMIQVNLFFLHCQVIHLLLTLLSPCLNNRNEILLQLCLLVILIRMYHVNVHFLFTFCATSCRYAVKQWLLLLLYEGNGGDPQPGPSHRPDIPQGLQYNFRKKSERTYAKNAAVDRTYQVKVNEQHHGERLEDIREGLRV